jgi:hypothetical protein
MNRVDLLFGATLAIVAATVVLIVLHQLDGRR